MTANDVSRAGRIPYSNVYDSLKSLHAKGWVEEQKSRPVVFTARPPDTALEELRSRQQTERKGFSPWARELREGPLRVPVELARDD